MSAGSLFAHDVFDANVVYQQRVADQRSMAAPWNRLRAHDGSPFLRGQLHEALQPQLKIRRLHVIGVAAKRGVAPAVID